MDAFTHTVTDGGWIALGTNRILHGLHGRPRFDLVLGKGHEHRRARHFAERHLLDVRHHSDNRSYWIAGRPDAYLLADRIFSRPVFLRHGAVDDRYRYGGQGVSLGDVPPAL